MMRALACLLALVFAGDASAQACREPAGRKGDRQGCPPSRRIEPYEPGRARAGSQPGFVDLGNGTEIRVGGRARIEYDVRR